MRRSHTAAALPGLLALLTLSVLGCGGPTEPAAAEGEGERSEPVRLVEKAPPVKPSVKAEAKTAAVAAKPPAQPPAKPPTPRPRHPGRAANPGPAELTWQAALGPGGATVREAEVRAGPGSGFSRLVGVIFGPQGEVHFVGVREPGKPLLDVGDLVDALVLSYRAREARADNPGVTIEPTPAQLARGLRAGDLMEVVYLGGVQGTVVGRDSLAGDLALKFLSSGVDNVTRKPVTSRVPGYRNVLDLRLALPAVAEEAWHRFWLEPAGNVVRQSRDGRAFLLETRLRAHTQYMKAVGGKLVPGGAAANPAAEAFVSHLTKNLDAFASEFPVLHRLTAYAQLASLAEAIRPAPAGEADRARPKLDLAWLRAGHQPRRVSTLKTTPAIIATKTVRAGLALRTLQQKGGVNLGPKKNTYRIGDSAAEDLARAVLGAGKGRPASLEVRVSGVSYQVLTHRPEAGLLTAWQTDLRAGDLAVVREYASTGAAGARWRLRLPRVSFARNTIRLGGVEGRRPRAIHIEDGVTTVTLDRLGLVELPGQPRTLGYLAGGGVTRRLLVYRKQLLYLDGEVQFLQRPGEAPFLSIPPGTRVVRFSGEPPHPVQEVRTATARVRYTFAAERLTALRDDAGNEIRLSYAGERLLRAEDVKGKKRVDYRYRRDGTLRAVVDQGGRALSYAYDRPGGRLLGVWADPPAEGAAAERTAGAFGYHVVPTPAQVRSAGRRWGDVILIRCLRESPAGAARPTYEIDFGDGRTLRVDPEEVDGRVGVLLSATATAAQKEEARQALRKVLGKAAEGDRPVLLVGHQVHDAALAFALLGLDKLIVHGADLDLALSNFVARSAAEVDKPLHDDGTWLRRGNVLVYKPGLSRRDQSALTQVLRGLEGKPVPGILIVVGHHTPEFEAACRGLDREVKGNTVVPFTCGTTDSHALAGEVLYQLGATGVSYFPRHLDPVLLPAVLRPFLAELAEERNNANAHDAVRRALRRSLERVRQDGRKGEFPPGLDREFGDDATQADKLRKLEEKLQPLGVLLQRLSRGPGGLRNAECGLRIEKQGGRPIRVPILHSAICNPHSAIDVTRSPNRSGPPRPAGRLAGFRRRTPTSAA
jgi:hypothetical protein